MKIVNHAFYSLIRVTIDIALPRSYHINCICAGLKFELCVFSGVFAACPRRERVSPRSSGG